MEKYRPARDLGAENPDIPEGNDYEYDEAHDVLAGPLGRTPAPHRVDPPPPKLNLGEGGDYGYDEAHDFGASMNNQKLTSRAWKSGGPAQ